MRFPFLNTEVLSAEPRPEKVDRVKCEGQLCDVSRLRVELEFTGNYISCIHGHV